MVNINSLERDGLRQAELCPRNTMMMNTNVRHRDVGDKYATGVQKIKDQDHDNICYVYNLRNALYVVLLPGEHRLYCILQIDSRIAFSSLSMMN